ncbi:PD40 domain-containing protein [Candidatus Bipolaricaulota bacterium]|nr:PD40 domain-containing protein [Candidatus Bipolaricaulota bacterium]
MSQLTTHVANDMRPAWFPDGTGLLFSSDRDGNHEIYEIRVDGTGLTRLTSTPLHELFPRLSPDGTSIVYTLGDFVGRRFEVHVMSVDRLHDQALTSGTHVSGEDPVWTGDGEKIVFQSDRTGNFEIFIMNADGSEQTNLTEMQSGEYWPSRGAGVSN